MKTLLVATDYSEASNRALEYAGLLARHIQAKIVLYNAFELPGEPGLLGHVSPHISKLLDENKLRLQEQANRIAQQFSVEVSCMSTISYTEEEIDRLAKELPADLVVMGMKKEAAAYPYFGSTTTAIIGKGKYPVLAVPEDALLKDPSRLLFACSYQCLAGNNHLPVLKEIAQAFKAKVEVLHVEKPEEQPVYQARPEAQDTKVLEKLLSGLPHVYRDVTEEDVVKGIERSIREYQADMLVMIPHRFGFWDGLFQRGTTRKMAFRTPVPLLCLPTSRD